MGGRVEMSSYLVLGEGNKVGLQAEQVQPVWACEGQVTEKTYGERTAWISTCLWWEKNSPYTEAS